MLVGAAAQADDLPTAHPPHAVLEQTTTGLWACATLFEAIASFAGDQSHLAQVIVACHAHAHAEQAHCTGVA